MTINRCLTNWFIGVQVTGNALEEDVRDFIQAGADKVLTKPVSRQKLEKELSTFGLLPTSATTNLQV